jgi:hypothetical protein
MMNERTLTLVALLCGAGAPLACSGGGAVNIGNTEVVGSQLSDYAASWDGYAEAYSFSPDGSDHVHLTIDASGQGTLRVGAGALLAPATDPTVGYPAGAFSSEVGPGPPSGTPVSSLGLVEGFLYPVHAARVQTDRIQLGVVPTDLWTTWCGLQTPVVAFGSNNDGGDVSYGCVANLPSSISGIGGTCSQLEPDGTNVAIDCGKLSLCQFGMACTCTAAACASVSVPATTPVDQYSVEIDGALDSTGTTLTGTLNLDGTRITVVLTKQ